MIDEKIKDQLTDKPMTDEEEKILVEENKKYHSRAALIERIPDLEPLIIEWEAKAKSPLVNMTHINIDANREIYFMQFEKDYFVEFRNKQNPDDLKTHGISLGRDTMFIFYVMYGLLADPEKDFEAFSLLDLEAHNLENDLKLRIDTVKDTLKGDQ